LGCSKIEATALKAQNTNNKLFGSGTLHVRFGSFATFIYFCNVRFSPIAIKQDGLLAALASGGRDNGESGLRKDYGANYYAAVAVDSDGCRLEAYCAAAA
jgi:hypothetical protein